MTEKLELLLATGLLAVLPLVAQPPNGWEPDGIADRSADPVSRASIQSRSGAESPSTAAFDSKLEMQGVAFRVVSPNRADANFVEITTAGLTHDNSPWKQEIDGVVVGAEVADLNADLSPEIYVFVRGRDVEVRASLVAYSSNRKRSLSAIYLPELEAQPGATRGFRGRDEMAVVENVIARRFPIFGDDGKPTGKWRQLQYKRVAGEAGWQLRVDRMIEF